MVTIQGAVLIVIVNPTQPPNCIQQSSVEGGRLTTTHTSTPMLPILLSPDITAVVCPSDHIITDHLTLISEMVQTEPMIIRLSAAVSPTTAPLTVD